MNLDRVTAERPVDLSAGVLDWDRLYLELAPRVYNYVRFRTGSHRDAEDLTSRTFIQRPLPPVNAAIVPETPRQRRPSLVSRAKGVAGPVTAAQSFVSAPPAQSWNSQSESPRA